MGTLLALGTMAALLNGCVILPTIPLNAPGYGHCYRVVDGNDQPVETGILLMVSVYLMAPDMVNCYEIELGRVNVPGKLATRYGHDLGRVLGTPTYFGMFHNPNFTHIQPLVVGHVPAWSRDGRIEGEFLDGLSPPPAKIQVIPADPETELEYLEYLDTGTGEYLTYLDTGTGVHDHGTRDDKAAWERALVYIRARLKQLSATQPAAAHIRARLKQLSATQPAAAQ